MRPPKLSKKLSEDGIRFVAFDVLDNVISEANITCPGLVVEVSNAFGKNLATEIVKRI